AWTSTGQVSATSQGVTMPGGTFDNGDSYEWQVRTWGLHPDPSNWSATATFVASTPPTSTVTSPTDPWEQAIATAGWTYYDSEGTTQSAWQARLSSGGLTLEDRNGNGAATSTVFNTRLNDA